MPWVKCQYCGQKEPDPKHHCSGKLASLHGYKRGRVYEREQCLKHLHDLWHFLNADLWHAVHNEMRNEKDIKKYLDDHFDICIKQIMEVKNDITKKDAEASKK